METVELVRVSAHVYQRVFERKLEIKLNGAISDVQFKPSVCCTKDGKIFRQNCKDITVVDTVGAGDSLSAGFLYMMLKGAPLQQALAFGSTLADYVCAHQGAIPEYDKELLNKFHYVQDKEGTF